MGTPPIKSIEQDKDEEARRLAAQQMAQAQAQALQQAWAQMAASKAQLQGPPIPGFNVLDALGKRQTDAAEAERNKQISDVAYQRYLASLPPPQPDPLARPVPMPAMAAAPAAPMPGPMGKMASAVTQTAMGASQPDKKMSKGGEVPHRVIHEADDHFVVHRHGDDKPFKVAKAGLGEKLINQIRGHGEPQKMAHGGEAEIPYYLRAPGEPGQLNLDPTALDAQAQGYQPSYNPWTDIKPGSPAEAIWKDVTRPGVEPGSPADSFMQNLTNQVTPGSPAESMMGAAGYQRALPQVPPQPSPQAGPGLATGMSGELTPQEVVRALSGQEQPTGPQQKGAGGSGFGAPGPDEISKYASQEQAAVQQKAGIEAQQAAQATQMWDQYNVQRSLLQQQQAEDRAKWQAGGEQLRADVLNTQIDPSRMWSSASVGQKIATGIGLLFGAFGAASNGGQNLVVKQLDQEIDRDVDAQKANLGKKMTLLQHHLQAGHDMLTAQQLAKADLLDGLRGQLEMNAAKFGGQMAQANAQMASAQIGQQAVVLRQQAAERKMQLALQAQNYSMQKAAFDAQIAQQAQQAKMLDAILSGQGGSGVRQALELPAFKDFRERMVTWPDGSVRFAPDKEQAGKAQESLNHTSELSSKLRRYRQILEEGHPTAGINSDRPKAKELRDGILLSINKLHDLNRINDFEAKKFEEMVPDITDVFNTGQAAKLDELGRMLDDKFRSADRMLSGAR